MADLSGRKVSFVRLHEATHVDGIGSVQTNISHTDMPNVKDKKIDMELSEAGVYCRATGVGANGSKQVEFIIPYAQCKSIQLIAETTTKVTIGTATKG
jgi:hypothetical protein